MGGGLFESWFGPLSQNVTSNCYRWGKFGIMLDYFVILWSFYLWIIPFGKIFDPELSLYFAFYAYYSLWAWLLSLVLQNNLIQQPPPNAWCESTPFANPPITIFLLSLYDTMRILHTLVFRVGVSKKSAVAVMIIADVVISLVVMVMENFSPLQVLYGWLWGIGVGLFGFYVLYFIWRPRFAVLAETASYSWMRRYDGVYHTPESAWLLGGAEKWQLI